LKMKIMGLVLLRFRIMFLIMIKTNNFELPDSDLAKAKPHSTALMGWTINRCKNLPEVRQYKCHF